MAVAMSADELAERLAAFENQIDTFISKHPTKRSDGNLSPEINQERDAIVAALAAPSIAAGYNLSFNIRNDLYGLMHSVQRARYIEDGHFEEWAYETGRAADAVAEHRRRIPQSRERMEWWRQEVLRLAGPTLLLAGRVILVSYVGVQGS